MRAIILTYLFIWIVSKILEKDKKKKAQNTNFPVNENIKNRGMDDIRERMQEKNRVKARKEQILKQKKMMRSFKDNIPAISLTQELALKRQGKGKYDMKAKRLSDHAMDMQVEHLSDMPRDFMKPERLLGEDRASSTNKGEDIAKGANMDEVKENATMDAYEKPITTKRSSPSLAHQAMIYREIIDAPVSMRQPRTF